jgi:hypothetical protein
MNNQAQPPREQRGDQQHKDFDYHNKPFTYSFRTVRWLVSTVSNVSCNRFV